MSGKALKQKLEERIEPLNEPNTDLIISKTNNVVPFFNSDSQIVSIVPDFAITLQEAKNRLQLLQSFVREMMVQGVDFGLVPGCQKPSLFKSGAEKLSDIFGFSKHIEILNRVEDWEKGIFHYEIKATLISKKTGHIEAEGLGSCNSKEKKYKSMDAANVVNTVLKMAKKRALIDAVLSATRSSGIFTQDLEDVESEASQINAHNNNFQTSTQEKSPSLADKNQLNQIVQMICQKKLSFSQAKDIMISKYNVSDSKNLTPAQADDFIMILKNYQVENLRK